MKNSSLKQMISEKIIEAGGKALLLAVYQRYFPTDATESVSPPKSLLVPLSMQLMLGTFCLFFVGSLLSVLVLLVEKFVHRSAKQMTERRKESMRIENVESESNRSADMMCSSPQMKIGNWVVLWGYEFGLCNVRNISFL